MAFAGCVGFQELVPRSHDNGIARASNKTKFTRETHNQAFEWNGVGVAILLGWQPEKRVTDG